MRKLVIPKYFGRPSIGLALFGCKNRPFYHVCVFPDRALGRRYESNILEQVGTFDPLPNTNNEKLVALNFGRLKYWIGERNAHISVPVLELLELQSGTEDCPSGLLTVDLFPLARVHSFYTLPHVQLNISIMAHSEVAALFVRLQCIHAPDGEDVYCHDSTRMIVAGKWRWPCRGILINSQVEVPLVFGYSCFRLYGLSQYYINVTAFPQNCRKSFLLTSPSDTQLFPSIAKFYENKYNASIPWSPVLYVDLTEADGVWFQVSYSKEFPARSIMLAVFEISGKNGAIVKKLDSYELAYPKTGVKWLNAAQGSYSVYAYIQGHDCSLLCDPLETSCTTCVHTHLNFTLPEDIASFSWKGLRTIRDSGIGVIFLVLAVCLILVISVSSVLYARRRLIRPSVTDLELNEYRKVHIVYSDDCEEHSQVVLETVRFLESTNCVNVTLDQRELISLSTRPATWLVDSIRKADTIIIIVSPLTKYLLNGNELVQRRPYPDLFRVAYDLIINEWSNNIADRRKFCIVTLPYSGCVPQQLSILNMDTFNVPTQMGELLMFIQNSSTARSSQSFLDVMPAQLFPLESAVRSMVHMMQNIPNWTVRRIHNKSSQGNAIDMALEEKRLPVNDEEEALLRENLDLLPPDEQKVKHAIFETCIIQPDEPSPHFELLERDDSSSDSD